MRHTYKRFAAEEVGTPADSDPVVTLSIEAPLSEWKKLREYVGRSNEVEVAFGFWEVIRRALEGR